MFELYVLAMVLEVFPLVGVRFIVRYTRAYWPILAGIILLLSMPDMMGRCDLHPPTMWWERLRFYSVEFFFTLCFLSGVMNTSDPWKLIPWLKWWSLFAYMTHVGWMRLLGSPYAPILTYSSSGIFYFW